MYQYTAIEREYGSGGRAVAAVLSDRLGIPCYGREVLERAGEYLHRPVSQLEKYEEKAAGRFLRAVNLLGGSQDPDPDLLTRDGHLFVAEQLAIRELAAHGPAVFLGHCACQALKETPGVLRVFIHADPASRRARITGEYGIPEGEVDSTIRRFDRKRAGYYAMNTGSRWLDFRNYDVILDSSTLGISGCADALESLIR